MKNYTYGWVLEQRGLVEKSESEYTEHQKEKKIFVEMLSNVVKAADCGWDGVWYKVMMREDALEEYMVLYVDEHGQRWIPISGNSKGCNLSVLGENLW